MGRETKKAAVWAVFLRGSVLALGSYAAGCLLAALLLFKGALPETALLPAVGVLCVLAAWLCGRYVCTRTAWGRLPAALLGAAVFGAILLLTGLAIWQELAWQGRGLLLPVCVLLGGALAGLTTRPKRRKKKRGRPRGAGK